MSDEVQDIPGQYGNGDVVAVQLLRGSQGAMHAIVFKHYGLSSLDRAAWCGGYRAVVVNSGRDRSLPADSWYPKGIEPIEAARKLVDLSATQWTCKRCTERAQKMLDSAAAKLLKAGEFQDA